MSNTLKLEPHHTATLMSDDERDALAARVVADVSALSKAAREAHFMATSEALCLPLSSSWVFALERRRKEGGTNVTHISAAADVLQLWAILHRVGVQHIPLQCDMNVFRAETPALWEHPANANGGRWMFTVPKDARKGGREIVRGGRATAPESAIARVFEALVLCAAGETLGAGVHGVCFAHRPKFHRVSVWTADKADDAAVLHVGSRIREEIGEFLRGGDLSYQAHNSSEYTQFLHIIKY